MSSSGRQAAVGVAVVGGDVTVGAAVGATVVGAGVASVLQMETSTSSRRLPPRRMLAFTMDRASIGDSFGQPSAIRAAFTPRSVTAPGHCADAVRLPGFSKHPHDTRAPLI